VNTLFICLWTKPLVCCWSTAELIRTVKFDAGKTHDVAMKALEDAGIYVFVVSNGFRSGAEESPTNLLRPIAKSVTGSQHGDYGHQSTRPHSLIQRTLHELPVP
jgi:hypothetical protein